MSKRRKGKRLRWRLTVRPDKTGRYMVGRLVLRRGRRRVTLQSVVDVMPIYRATRVRIAGDPEVAGFSLKKLWRQAKNTAKDAAKSKVWKVAEKVTALGAVLPPPAGPALAATSGALRGTRALLAAKKAQSAGRPDIAQKLVQAAGKVAKAAPDMPGLAQPMQSRRPQYLALLPGA